MQHPPMSSVPPPGAAAPPHDGLGPTVTQLPKRYGDQSRGGTVPHTPQMQRHFGDPGGGGQIPEMTRAVDHRQAAQQNLNGSFLNMSGMPRSSTFNSKGVHGPPSGMVSPTGAGAGLGLGPQGGLQRGASFPAQQGYPGPGTPGPQHGAMLPGQGPPPGSGAYSMMGSQRNMSPPRQHPQHQQHPQGSAVFAPQMPGRGPHSQQPTPQMSHAGPPVQQPQSLDVSQRMARANDLMQRLMGPGGANGSAAVGARGSGAPQPQAAPLPFNLNTPNLLNWAREQHAHHGQARGAGLGGAGADGFEPPPPRQAPAASQVADPDLDFGLSTLHDLPPPPRNAPAAQAGPSGSFALGGSGRGGEGCGGSRYSLTVLTSDSRWETLGFYAGENLDQKGEEFLAQKGLKAAFHPGLVSKMRSMITMGQAQASVDIVDLL